MKRKIVKIDAAKCNGCGACASACHEGAIVMEGGKARLIRDDYCDGLGACLPSCPTGAISIEEREAADFDAEAVAARMKGESAMKDAHENKAPLPCGCPGSAARAIDRDAPAPRAHANTQASSGESRLRQWPVQIKLVPINAPYFDGAKLLVAADCTAYACGDMHERFIRGHITLIGCPKLDDVDYGEKLRAIIESHDIKSISVVRMEVPCCGGIEAAVVKALKESGKMIPWQVTVVSTDGEILD